MPDSPRDWRGALNWAAAQSHDRSKVWTGRCQEFCRTSYGCPGGFASAIAQWYGMPADARHPGGSPSDAPIGAMLFSKGNSPGASSTRFGHVMLAARPFRDGTPAAWSTDAVRTGWPDKVGRAGLYAKWNHTYLGYGTNMNGYDLRFREPKRTQTNRYEALTNSITALDKAIEGLRTAKATAKNQGDADDEKRFTDELDIVQAEKKRLKKMYDGLRRL